MEKLRLPIPQILNIVRVYNLWPSRNIQTSFFCWQPHWGAPESLQRHPGQICLCPTLCYAAIIAWQLPGTRLMFDHLFEECTAGGTTKIWTHSSVEGKRTSRFQMQLLSLAFLEVRWKLLLYAVWPTYFARFPGSEFKFPQYWSSF